MNFYLVNCPRTPSLRDTALLYETLRVACNSCGVRQAQGIALRVACFHEVVRQGGTVSPSASSG
ncbi:hypothetical protein [Nostoc sp.]